MKPIEVKYNGVEITPTPLVSRSYQFIDYGNRFGQLESIELSCYITGIGNSYLTSINNLNSLFSEQFKTLEVNELGGAGNIYKWENIVLQDIEIPQNHFSVGTFTPYKAKFVSYQIPSGVLDPSNEYAFSEGEDGVVSVTHKISAKGVRTDKTPIDNAIAFVNTFVKKNPYNSCAPIFIPNSSGILMSISESLDRTSSTYSVSEIYKYTTGQANVGYLKTTNVSINDSNSNDFINVDINVILQGSPVEKNHTELQNAAKSIDLTATLKDYGFSTEKIYRDGYIASYESGAVRVELKGSYISGLDSDLSGYFDYSISFDTDLVPNITNWRIDGEYITRGPMNIRKTQLNSFKTTNQSVGYIPYLNNLLNNSSLYSQYGGGYPLNIIQVNLSEDTGRALFKLSANFSDYDNYSGYIQPKYSLEISPAKWIYEMVPAANIEGHYIVQDLQMTNKGRVKASFTAITTGENSSNYSKGVELLNTLSGIYLYSGAFLMNNSVSSGISNITIEQDFIGDEKMTTGSLTTKAYGGYTNNFIREPNYKFGY